MSEQPNQPETAKRTINEELEVAGNKLVETIQDIIHQGNVRRIIIRNADDRILLETTLTVGAGVGGVLALTPVGLPLAVLTVIAAAVGRVRIEIVREVNDDDVLPDDGKRKIEIAGEE